MCRRCVISVETNFRLCVDGVLYRLEQTVGDVQTVLYWLEQTVGDVQTVCYTGWNKL
jgi:hypothetical protein